MKTLYFLFISFFATITVAAQVLDGVKLNDACMPAVVCITTPDGFGSGFVVNKNGYIVTNCHVIENAKQKGITYWPSGITVEFSDGNKEVCTEIVRVDKKNDLALLRIKQGNYTALPIYNGTEKVGAKVGAFGCPLGGKMQFNEGNISNTNLINLQTKLPDTLRIQVDVAVNPGNSGGAIVNKNGQVVAVVHTKHKTATGINFAIKSTVLIEFLNKANINISHKQLLTDEELKTASRQLSKEEEEKAKNANLKVIENKEQVDKIQTNAEITVIKEAVKTITESEEEERKTNAKRAEADRQRIDEERRAEAAFNRLNAAQKEEYLAQKAKQERELSATQHKWSIESIEDQGKRKRMRLDQDILAQDQAEHKYKKEMIAYRLSLPQRFSTRIGAGATYYIGTLGVTNSSTFDMDNFGLAGDITFAYRLDRKGNNRRSRATSIGGGLKFGAWNSPSMSKIITAQDWNSNYANLRNEHLFMELSGGFLLREWFKIDGGYGQQYIYANNDIYTKNYGVMTLGFIARFGAIELEATASGLFLGHFEKPTLRANLQLVYHAKWGKF